MPYLHRKTVWCSDNGHRTVCFSPVAAFVRMAIAGQIKGLFGISGFYACK